MKLETMVVKFWERVHIPPGDGCWEWGGKKNNWGYGIAQRFYKTHVASRISYEYFNGAIENNLCVLHHCDNRLCVRPDHLFLGTRADNCADKISKGRENYKPKKLNRVSVVVIRERLLAGESQRSVATDYGISQSMVWRIKSRDCWKSVA